MTTIFYNRRGKRKVVERGAPTTQVENIAKAYGIGGVGDVEQVNGRAATLIDEQKTGVVKESFMDVARRKMDEIRRRRTKEG